MFRKQKLMLWECTECGKQVDMKDSEKVMEIYESEYNELQKDSDFLRCLKAAGVDNWDGFYVALEMLDSDEY